MSLAFVDLKNEPCPQSWEMMKMRTRNPPARAIRGAVIHQEIARLRYIKYHRTA